MSLSKLLQFGIVGQSAPLSERKVARDKVDGFTISTAYTEDQGYETAIGDTHGNYHPVERYDTKQEAVKGHPKWIEFIEKGERDITQLGYDDVVKAEKMTLT